MGSPLRLNKMIDFLNFNEFLRKTEEKNVMKYKKG